jgi:general secretion pathway protein D
MRRSTAAVVGIGSSNKGLVEAKIIYPIALLCLGLASCATTSGNNPQAKTHPRTFSSFDVSSGHKAEEEFALGTLNFQNADLTQVLAVYQEISARTVIRPATLPAPTISVRNQTPLSRVQALQLLDTVLAQNGIAMILVGETAVKAVPEVRAPSESPPEITLPWKDLPDSGSFMMRKVQLKTLRPSEVVPVLQPLAKTPNSILPIDYSKELVLRDYSSNIRRMLQLLQDLESNSVR